MISDQRGRQAAPRDVYSGMQAIATRVASRRNLFALASRCSNRRFAFALAAVSVLAAKGVHIYSHVAALSQDHLARWGYSFFAQDLALLLLIRLFLDNWTSTLVQPLQCLVTRAVGVLLSIVIALGVINVSFFVVSGSEIHWRDIGLAGDASSWSMFLSGLFSLALVACFAFAAGWVLQDLLFGLFGLGSNLIKWPLAAILRNTPAVNRLAVDTSIYDRVPQDDDDFDAKEYADEDDVCLTGLLADRERSGFPQWIMTTLYVFVFVVLTAQIGMSAIRPHDSAMIFLSWTSIILPFVEISDSSPNLYNLTPLFKSGIGQSWDNMTTTHNVSALPGLSIPLAAKLDFWDRYVSERHYDAAYDPLRITNMNDTLLPDLRAGLDSVPIRHVVLLFLESTRKDVFPLKKDGLIWQRLSESWENGTLPWQAEAKLANMSRNANLITGDYDDGFAHPLGEKRRGGINFNNAHTAATYTLKSLEGTLCGVAPVVGDFNLEGSHKRPAPCLPHIFDAMNHMKITGMAKGRKGAGKKFLKDKWRSTFMQSATMEFDGQKHLMTYMGFPENGLISKEYLKGERGNNPKHGVSPLRDVNYFGIPETPLEDYIRDAFVSAKKNKERVFLSHLTSTSHHPFGLPKNHTYVPLGQGMDDLSRYVNSIAFDDQWIGKILKVIDEQGAANETLVVMVGDHGLSMPENGLVSSYHNANVGNSHVPLVFSHPQLPVINVDDAVTSIQILPTILDLLVQTGSLAPDHAQFAQGLTARSYEGQTMIRELRKSSESGEGDWQFTIVNPGGAMVAVRDARQPALRLIVPIIDTREWSFTDTSSDPTEAHPVQAFEFAAFIRRIERIHGKAAARWAHDAAFISRWWIKENGNRWMYHRN
ncbi:sulfatase domain protein [Moelleriella libera RCEF 2490]|uniref:Sulfatase domain protein n=1 Tax=Moelleriella libera RCEF 2490 TaxID=1081109 RepID=A0A168ANR3_9HYPO|nr:sulfatase domain protein [Moelleriella libera RCEF 2490]